MTPFELQLPQNARLFAASLVLGIAFGLYFEVFRFLRRLFPAPGWLTAIEDLLFWLPAAPVFFLFTYAFSEGVLRWFSVAGAILGFLLYRLTLGRLVFRAYSSLIRALKRALRALFAPLLKFLRKTFERLLRPLKTFVILKKEERQKKRALKRKARKGDPDEKRVWIFCDSGAGGAPGFSRDLHRGKEYRDQQSGK